MQPGVAAFDDTVVDGDIVYDSVISVVHIPARLFGGKDSTTRERTATTTRGIETHGR